MYEELARIVMPPWKNGSNSPSPLSTLAKLYRYYAESVARYDRIG